MQGRKKIIFLSLLCFFSAHWDFSGPAFAAEMTIVGEVNYSYQIWANGQIYEVANTAMGDDLVMNHIAKKVEVTGTVEDKRDMKKITVRSFKIVPETNHYTREQHYGDEKEVCRSCDVCDDPVPQAFWNDSLIGRHHGEIEISPQEFEAPFNNNSEFKGDDYRKELEE
jgi:hypothetical protein